jgi:hypothetical protein
MGMRVACELTGRGVGALVAALAASVALTACQADGAPAQTLADDGALRAKVSVCLGIDAAAAFTFFWPEHMGGAPDARNCVAAAAGCADVLACAGYTRAGCTAADDRCDGGKAIACLALTKDLTVVAESSCEADPAGDTVCSIEDDLKHGRGAFCHGGACAGERCDGSTIVRCRGGLEVRSDCAREGKGCAVAYGEAFCAYEQTCAVDRCAGDVIELCESGRVVVRERCGDLVTGSACTDGMGRVECLADVASDGCADKIEFQSWCEGATAVTCFAGVRAEMDCGALADGRCAETMRDTLPEARCAGTF